MIGPSLERVRESLGGRIDDISGRGWPPISSSGTKGPKGEALERLHLDHERPLHETCHRWRTAFPRCSTPRSSDDGLDGAGLCHDLFGVCASEAHGEAFVRFWCGPPRDAEERTRVPQFVDHAYCHRS